MLSVFQNCGQALPAANTVPSAKQRETPTPSYEHYTLPESQLHGLYVTTLDHQTPQVPRLPPPCV